MKIKKCRFCGKSDFKVFLNLGKFPPADQFLSTPYSKNKAKKYPLEVVICGNCALVQLNYTCSGKILYQQNYPYESDITNEGRNHWKTFAMDIIDRFKLKKNDLVMDIGSNVGELLINFANEKIKVCGVDPAKNIAKKAIKRGIPTITEFFNKEIEDTLIKKKIFPKIITGTNVFAHIDDIEGSIKVIKNILKPDGVLVIEAPYLKNLIAGLEYDTIYHEHLMYLSVNPMIDLFKKFEFEIFDIQFKDIHGGSIRVFVKHKDGPFRISSKIKRISENEIKEKLNSVRTLSKFSKQVESHRRKLRNLLKKLKSNGKKIACVGAPAKGMTLLNYNKLNNDIIEFVTEVSKLKLNKYCPGTDLKIVDDNKLIANKIDYALILPWNFKNEIMKNLKDFKKSGGRFIIPLPKIQII